MKLYIIAKEFILDHGEAIAAIVITVTMGTLFGTIIGLYLADGLF